MAKTLRSDGVEARNRLLDAALEPFAEKGYSKTSTREIASAAQVNIASISYYFRDKAGFVPGGVHRPA
ncbi:MAG: TetR family transcriptional regulator [Rhodoferax sp.]|nr:TetR family transcriptional regulator [Rhodoferax sp.]